MKPEIVDVTEQKRLNDAREAQIPWKKWGPYLSERQWGTVREDYSEGGDAWNYFTHDHARSRAYRWGEDGLGGLCDDKQRLCFALALWNEHDPILKERLFGLTNSEANHGEDVEEYYFYLDSTPTHSYMKYLYKYPQREYPYRELIETNRRRSREEFEYELLDTGIFNDDRYFDVFVEYAKESPEDVLVRITVHNRGPEAARLRVLPTLWFRNTWSWGDDDRKPSLREVGPGAIRATHHELGAYWFYCDGAPELLFTENGSNAQRLWGQPNGSPYVKDAFHQYIIAGRSEAVNPAKTGTKAAAHYVLEVPGGGSRTVQLRLVAAATKDCLWRFREDVQKPHRRRRRILRPDFTQIAERRSAPGASPGENEFFGPYGIRSLSRYHLEHPFVLLLQTGIAGATQRLMAMFNGTMDATLTQVDTILLAQIKLGKDVSVLGGLLETGYRATGADIMTSRRFLREKPDVARRFMMAIVEGIHMARTQKDRALRMISKQLKENDPRILEAQYRTFVIDTFPTKPYPDEVTVRFSLEELDREFPGAKDKNVSQFIDAGLLKAIDQSGFIDKLYK